MQRFLCGGTGQQDAEAKNPNCQQRPHLVNVPKPGYLASPCGTTHEPTATRKPRERLRCAIAIDALDNSGMGMADALQDYSFEYVWSECALLGEIRDLLGPLPQDREDVQHQLQLTEYVIEEFEQELRRRADLAERVAAIVQARQEPA